MVAARGRGNRRGETSRRAETSTTGPPYSGTVTYSRRILGNAGAMPTGCADCWRWPDRDSDGMQKASLAAVARQQVDRDAGGGGRHTAEGARLAEHETRASEATVQVLHGRVRMISGAQDDSAVLLTVASGPDLMVLCRPADARQRGLVKPSVPCEHGG